MGKGNENAKAPLKQSTPTNKSKMVALAATAVTKRNKRGEAVDPLFLNAPSDAYAPYFEVYMDEVNVDYDNKEDEDDKLDNEVEVYYIDQGADGDVYIVPILNNMM